MINTLNKELDNIKVKNRIYSTDSLKEMISLLSSPTLREKDKETILKTVDNFIDYLNGYIQDNEL